MGMTRATASSSRTNEARPDEERSRGELRRQLTIAGLIVGLSTLLLPHAEPITPLPLLAGIVLAILLIPLLRVRAVGWFFERWGEIVGIAITALVIAGTGGAESVYQDMYVLPLLMAGSLKGQRALLLKVLATAAFAILPAFYDNAPTSFLTDVLVDTLVWSLAAGFVQASAATQRRQASDLEASEQRFRMLADSVHDGIYRLRLLPEPAFEYVNPAIEEMTGFTAAAFYADPDLPLRQVLTEDLGKVRASRVAPGSDPTSVVRWQHPVRGVVWHELRESPLLDAQGRVIGMQGVMRDISEQIVREADLRADLERQHETSARLRQLDEMKNSFLRAVSHELRTPLSSVLGFALTLQHQRGQLDDDQIQDMFGRLASNARKLERLLGDLLDVDRLSRGILEVTRRDTDLAALAQGVVADLPMAGHRLEFSADAVCVDLDAPKVERLIENLLANAVKHTPNGTCIWLRIRAAEGGATIVVEDDGPGIPDDLKARVLEPFGQGPQSTEHPSPGTGIGLTLVNEFAVLHGGGVTVEDRTGGGARFVVDLPGRCTEPADISDHAAVGEPRPQRLATPLG